MDKLHAMSVFVAVVEAGSFAAAARSMALSPPAVTRSVAALEQHLGTALLLRTTRQVRLTDAGQQYLVDARRILAELHQAEESIAGVHAEPAGQLVVTAPVMFGRLYIMPIVSAYLESYPKMSVAAVLLDRNTNLLEEGIDVGIRIGALPDSSLRAVTLGYVSQRVYAAPKYVQRFGEPRSPADLQQHRTIASLAGNRGLSWRFSQDGQEMGVKITPVLTSTTNDAVIAAAVDGLGITRVLSYQAAPQVAAGQLQPVLQDYELPPIPVSLVHPQGRNIPAKVRTFMDLVIQVLREQEILQSV